MKKRILQLETSRGLECDAEKTKTKLQTLNQQKNVDFQGLLINSIQGVRKPNGRGGITPFQTL